MFKYLITALVAMTFVGCSFDKKGNAASDQKARENQRAEDNFNAIKGDYEGTLLKNNVEYKVSLSLNYIKETTDQKDDNGQPMTRIVPRGNFKMIYPVGSTYTFDVEYVRETGKLNLINVDAKNAGPGATSNLGPDEIHTVISSIRVEKATDGTEQRRIVGDARNKSAVTIGILNVVLVSKEQTLPDEKQDQEYYDRLRKELETVVGDYVGNSVLDGKAQEYILSIRLRPQPVGDLAAPELYGFFKRTDDTKDVARLRLSFRYMNDVTPRRLYMEGVPVNYPGSPYVAKLEGALINNAYLGSWSTNRGFEGTLELKKVKSASDEETSAPRTGECLEQQILAAKWPTLPEKGPIPTPRPNCP